MYKNANYNIYMKLHANAKAAAYRNTARNASVFFLLHLNFNIYRSVRMR